MMNVWLSEILRAWRASLRKPGFLLLATGVLALGVASTTAVFALIDNVLLQPLPYAQPMQLVSVGTQHFNAVTPQEYQHLQGLSGVQSMGLVAARQRPVNVTGGGKPVQITARGVDHHLLPTLGVRLLAGRNFTAAEDQPHGPRAAILSYGFWQRRFGGRSDVIGHSIQLEGQACTIIGVLPENFDLLGGSDVLLPTALPAGSTDAGMNFLAIARMAPGSSIRAVSAEVDTRLHAMYAAMGGKMGARARRMRFDAVSLRSRLHEGSKSVLTMFLACALIVLLVALVNLVNMMLLRALARSHDVAVRGALGANRMRLALPSLAEGLLIGVAGAMVGAALARLGLTLLQGMIPGAWLGHAGLHFGASTWGLAFALGIGIALLSALLGLWRGHAATTVDELREGGRSGLSRHRGLLGRVLVVAQVTLATALLLGAGLFLNTLYRAANTPLGFSTQGVLTFELAPVKTLYTDTTAVHQLAQRVLRQLHAAPGVQAATVGTNLPVGAQFNMPMKLPGKAPVSVQFRAVSSGFFSTYGIPVRAGRAFAKTDVHGGEPVAVVNRAFARRYFGGHALGKTVQLLSVAGDGPQPLMRVVGVVGNTRQFGPLSDTPPILYTSLAQVPDGLMKLLAKSIPLRFAVRVHGRPDTYRNTVHASVVAVAPQQPIANVQSLDSIARGTTDATRLDLLLIGLFAVLALLLAAAGMYAVMAVAVAVAAREREFGVRLALGAAPARLARLVVRTGMLQVAAGLVLGVILGWALTRVLRSAMERAGQAGFAPSVVVGVCVVLAIAGLLACLIPAIRAARVQPMHALRGE